MACVTPPESPTDLEWRPFVQEIYSHLRNWPRPSRFISTTNSLVWVLHKAMMRSKHPESGNMGLSRSKTSENGRIAVIDQTKLAVNSCIAVGTVMSKDKARQGSMLENFREYHGSYEYLGMQARRRRHQILTVTSSTK